MLFRSQGCEGGHPLEAVAWALSIHRLEVVESPDAIEAEVLGEAHALQDLRPLQPLLGHIEAKSHSVIVTSEGWTVRGGSLGRPGRRESGQAEIVSSTALLDVRPPAPPAGGRSGKGENRNVNRLVDGQEIAFNDRMTVVYGENASGKTEYARVLKQAAGVRSAARVLPDVYTSSPGKPTAFIEARKT